MIETRAPAAVRARDSCQTRRSNGSGRFSTMISTLRPASGLGASDAASGACATRGFDGDARLAIDGSAQGVDVDDPGALQGQGAAASVGVDHQVVVPALG